MVLFGIDIFGMKLSNMFLIDPTFGQGFEPKFFVESYCLPHSFDQFFFKPKISVSNSMALIPREKNIYRIQNYFTFSSTYNVLHAMSFNVSIDEHSCPSSHCEENDAVSGVAFGRDTDSDCSSEASFLNQENGSFERTFSSCTESISPHHRLANDHSYASPSTCGSLVTSESDGEIPPPPPSDCSDFLSEHSLASRCESVDESVPNGIYEEHRSRFHNNFDQNFLSTNKMKQCAGDCSCKSFVGDDDDGISIEVGKRQLDSKINRSDGYLDTAKSVIFRRSYDLNLGFSEAKLLQSQSKIEKGPVARDSLLSIFKIARIFSLRCSLDHWKFFIKHCEVKESDFNRIGPTLPRHDMQRHALCMFECFMRVGAKRYAYSVLVRKACTSIIISSS